MYTFKYVFALCVVGASVVGGVDEVNKLLLQSAKDDIERTLLPK